MAFVHFDSSYAPCAFLIVPDGGDPYDDSQTALVQLDWDFPGVAQSMGWSIGCDCPTDGTVDCEHRTAGDHIAAAYDYIRERDGESFDALDEYLNPGSL